MGNDNHINMDDEYFKRATKRAKLFGAYTTFETIVFLEKKIEEYKNKTDTLTTIIRNTAQKTTQLEAAQENTVNEIIKALANNGYNTITINCYRDAESEE